MIPNSKSPNLLNDNEKQQEENGVYTPVYTSDFELKFIVDHWNQLSEDVNQIILNLVNNYQKYRNLM